MLQPLLGIVNIAEYLSMDTASYPRRLASSSTRLWEPQHSFFSQSLRILYLYNNV